MKNCATFLLITLMLSGCIKAGDFDLLPIRKGIVNSIRGYSVNDFEGNSSSAVTSVRENDVIMNKAMTAKKGDTILSDKFFDRETYKEIVFMPTMSGNLQSSLGVLNIDARKTYKVSKWVRIDSVKYYLLESNVDDYFYLFDEDGNFYEQNGVIKDGNLILMEDDIMIYPSNLKMKATEQMRDVISNIHKGYEVKYSGRDIGRIWFDYLEYRGSGDNGEFERISFPDKPGLINISGTGMRVLQADDDTITYMILKHED